jgi:predicted nuclease with RNAse H fold
MVRERDCWWCTAIWPSRGHLDGPGVIRTLGVDLAAATTNTAACLLEWDDGPARIAHLATGDVTDQAIVQLAQEASVTGIDAPFGWPQPFVDAVAGYAAGRPWPRVRPEGLWLRRTDERALAVSGGRAPLSVSSDRIARPAERAARLLTLLGSSEHAAARDGSDGVIEVYPAGALRCWGVESAGYKRPDGLAPRQNIVDLVAPQVGLVLMPSERALLCATDHAIDALVASLVARAFAHGRVVRPTTEETALAAAEGWLFLPSGRLADLI